MCEFVKNIRLFIISINNFKLLGNLYFFKI